MAYVGTIGNLQLGKLAKQDDASFQEDLALLRGAGLSQFASDWLTKSVKQVYDARVAYDTQITKDWSDWKAKAQPLTRGGPALHFGQYYSQYPFPESLGIGFEDMRIFLDVPVGSNVGKTISAFDYYVAAIKLWDTVKAARAFDEKFIENNGYYPIWPFPNVALGDRTVNGIPLVMAFRLDGSTMNSVKEYETYWYSLMPPEMTGSNTTTPTNRIFIQHAPKYASFLQAFQNFWGAAAPVSPAFNIYGPGRNVATTCYTRGWRYACNSWQTPLIGKSPAVSYLGFITAQPGGWPADEQFRFYANNLNNGITNSAAAAIIASNYTFTPAGYDLLNDPARAMQTLSAAVRSEIHFRWNKPPPPPPPARKRKWWQKVLGTYIPFIAPIVAVATGGLASGLVAFVGMKTGDMVAQKVGGIGGLILGGITSGAVGSFAQLANFVPAGSAISPSYKLTQMVMQVSPLSPPINQVISKGFDAVIQKYIGVAPETLAKLNTNALLQAGAIAASIAAPKTTPIVLGSITAIGQFDKLMAPMNYEQFLPAAKTTALAFVPQFSKEIRVSYEMAKGLPTALEGLQVVPQLLAKGLDYLGQGLVKVPELIGQVIVKSPELAVKGMTYTLTHATPLVLEGIQETGKVIVKAPELVFKGAEFVAVKGMPLALEGIQETAKVVVKSPELAVKGLEFVAVKGAPLVLEGLEESGKVVIKAPELALKGLEYAAVKTAPLVLEGLQESGKVLLEAPQLAAKGLTFVAEKSVPLLLEGLEESGKVLIKAPELAVKGLSYVAEKLPNLLVKGLEQVGKLELPSAPTMTLDYLPQMQVATPVLVMPQPTTPVDVLRPVTTVQQDTKTVVKEPVVITKSPTGEEIIHLPAVPIEDNSLAWLALGGLALIAVTAAATE